MNRRGIFASMALAVGTLTVSLAAGTPAPAGAVASLTVARYEMNEAVGATTLVDTSGNGLNGTIGTEVTTNAAFSGSVGHRYAYLAPDTPPAHPQHLDKVPDNSLLDAGTSDYAVTVRYRTTRSFGNLIQKGQNKAAGGYFKVELPAGKVTCLYKGSRGEQRAVISPNAINDGQWHTIRCERLAAAVSLYIDGVRVARLAGGTGSISNVNNLSIAGKSDCDQLTVTCDYFVGDIDYVQIEKGAGVANTPPVASFTQTCTNLTCTFNGSASSDPGGSIVTYAWNFGDGTTGSGPTPPAHAYTTAGSKNVSLTVTDNGGLTNTTSHAVVVTSPNPPPTAAYTYSCTDLACTFDASTSTDVAPGTIAGYSWNWNDGTAAGTGATPSHTFTSAGLKTVALTVTDNGGATNTTSKQITVTGPNTAPTAAFTVTCADFSCSFDATGSTDAQNNIATYSWDFGDGSPAATGATVTHPYAEGHYDPVLTVTDAGSLPDTETHPVDIAAQANPTAAFTVTCTGQTCSFDASTSTDPNGPIASYAWDFGDTTNGSGVTTSHPYADGVDHTVTLTVTDGQLNTGMASQTATPRVVVDNITFVGQASSSVNNSVHVANVPAAVQPGDALLMFFSTGSSTTVSTPTGVTGWTLVDTLTNTNGTTRLYKKVAAAGDAGTQVRIDVSPLAKANLMVVAYRGTSAADPIAAFARTLQTNTTASRTTPQATVAGAGSWAVSYWMHRDSASTSLTPPAGVTSRSTGNQSGGGRVTTLLADSAAPVPAGTYGGQTATANAASSLGTTWTVILAPA